MRRRKFSTCPTRPPRRVMPRLLIGAAALCLALGAHALSFTETLGAALAYDAPYRAAGYEYQATQFGVPIARASLLPSVSLNASDSRIVGSRTFPNGQNQEVRLPLDYSAPQTSLQMRLPIFNFEALSGYRQAKAQAEAAEASYRTQGFDLMDRLVTAYLQTLIADEGRRLAQGQIKQYEVQVNQTEQRLGRGEGTRVQVSTARANLDVARARLLEAIDQVDLARSRLERLTGMNDITANQLPARPVVEPLFPDRMGDWLDLAIRQSPTLQTRERYREVARQARKRQEAGHLPRLDMIASLSRNENEASNTVGQGTVLRAVGVQLTVPIFNGGGVDASIRQASAREAQAEQEARTEREAIEVDVQRHFQATLNGEKKVAAYVTALESTDLAARGAQRAMETGIGTLSEAADTEAARFNASRDLLQARVEVLLSRARLMMRAGMPLIDVAQEVDRALLPATSATTQSSGSPSTATPASKP